MSNKEADIETLLSSNHIDLRIRRVDNTSHLYSAISNHCFQVRIDNGEHVRTVRVYAGLGWNQLEDGHVMRIAIVSAEEYACLETFERWEKENEDLIHTVGRTVAKALYSYSKNLYDKLYTVLGHDIYYALVDIEND